MALPSSFPSFPSENYPPHLNAAVDVATLKALAEANDARAGYPGPVTHRAQGDITAVLMRMVEEGAITPAVATVIAHARGLNPSTNGAYYSRLCKPRIMWRGLDFDAAMFNDLYRAECAASDAVVDGLPMTGGLGARQKPVAWLGMDETLEWPAPTLRDRLAALRPSQRVLDVLAVAVVVVGVPLVALALWEILASLVTIWPWIAGGSW